LKEAEFQIRKIDEENELMVQDEEKQAEFEQRERLLEIKGRMYTPEVLRAKLI